METTLRTGIKAGIFLMLLMPFIIVSDSLFPFIVGKALYARAVIEVIVALWLLLLWVAPKYRAPRSWVLVVLLVYLLITLLAGITGVSLTRSLWSTYGRMGGIVDLAHWIAFVMVLASLLRSLADWRPILRAAVVVSGAMALIGLAQYYGVLLPSPQFPTASRVAGTLGNATFLGAYLLVNFFLALALLGDSLALQAPPPGRRPRRQRRKAPAPTRFPGGWSALWIGIAGLDLWVLMLTGTRGAFIGLVAGLLAAVIMAYPVWGQRPLLRWTLWGLLAAVVLLLGAAFLFRDSSVMERAASSNPLFSRLTGGLSGASVQVRLLSARAGVRAFLERPVLGWGPENYTVPFDLYVEPEYFAISGEYFDKAHNKVVEEMTTKGALGLVSYGLLWGLLLGVLILRVRGRPPERLFLVGIGGALVAYFVQNLFLFDTPAPLLQFMLLVGLVATLEGPVLPWGAPPRLPALARFARRGHPSPGPSARARRGPLPSIPQRLRGWVLQLRADPISFPTATAVLAAMLLAATGLLVHHANYKPYEGATLIQPLLTQPDTRVLPWDRRVALARSSFAAFPALANKPRMFFFETTAVNWFTISEEVQRDILALAEKEGYEALRQEPLDLRIWLSLAWLYQQARSLDPSHLDRAQEQLDVAKALSPYRPQVLSLLKRQQELRQEQEESASTEGWKGSKGTP